MKVLSISRDKDQRLFKENSDIRKRMIEYGAHAERFHIIVFTLKADGLCDIEISKNVFVHPTNSISRLAYVFDAICLGKKILIESRFVRGDAVVTAQDPFECGYVAWRIATAFRLPLHLQIHTDFLSPYFITSFFQWIRVRTARFLLPKAAGIRVVSESIAESITHARIVLQNVPQVLPIRVDTESIEKSIPIDLHTPFPQFKFTVLVASRLSKEKRITDALRAFQKVLQAYSFAGLLIAGTGPEKSNLERLVRELGISNNVVFLGFRDDVYSLMKSVNVFLSISEFEGYGMSLVEAGLVGVPVISTDVGIAKTLLKDGLNSFVCPVGDVDCMSAKIAKLISDTAVREIVAGRLSSDVRATIPSKEEYVKEWVKGLEEIRNNF